MGTWKNRLLTVTFGCYRTNENDTLSIRLYSAKHLIAHIYLYNKMANKKS